MSEVDYEEAMKMVMEEKKVYKSLLGWQEKIRGATYNYNFYSTKMFFTRDTGFEMCPVCREAVEDSHIVSLKFKCLNVPQSLKGSCQYLKFLKDSFKKIEFKPTSENL